MTILKSSSRNTFFVRGINLAVLLLGMLLLSSCAATSSTFSLSASSPLKTISSEAGIDSAFFIADAQASDEEQYEDQGLEEDPFEEDPFEEDPFEEDPFDNTGDAQKKMIEIADPLSGWNRIVFSFNDKLYYWVLKPVAKGYRGVMPKTVRIGMNNFFTNLLGPLRFVNCVLQGKGEAADAELVRFVMNSTVGFLGFGNPAKNYPELTINDEDFGQTFAQWGIGHGFYIVWPVFGPSSLRDSFGMLGDYFLKPVSYVEPLEASIGVWAVDEINATSFRLGDYESLKEASLDPYEAFRNAYIQYRRNQVGK